jgi:hypothetical protein
VPSIAQSGRRRIAVSVKILEAVHASYVMSSRVETSLIFKNRELKWLSLKKTYIQPPHNARLENCMRKKMNTVLNGYRRDDPTLAAMEEMQSYCLAHPGSPAAVRRPRMSMRGDLWVALLGPTVEKGVVGIGPSVQAALRAFDAQYFSLLRPATEATKIRDSAYRACNRAAQIQPGLRC